ncbi:MULTISPECIES: hypothetical protein [unclassified Mycobacterium]|uniref:hypothetical protein n=1 Tax=unclassified Mycobacterium TaxID=2642494 RepID=UPI00073FC759|nr:MULTISPECIES: hypothetical protein [unclassified Mycobacterium]KUH86331.1 hypothetical protein AU187_06045 [Mycobacterium sp. IS-1556]KUH86743.1 hypothetical protein AU185_19310 [Mycobacterium sp. GA-0227b]KUH92022.1 hypothetical protein AU186_06025 [Mycobacterium sp. GA-1999]
MFERLVDAAVTARDAAAAVGGWARVENAACARRLVRDPDAIAKIDAEVAAQLEGWTTLSKNRVQTSVDYCNKPPPF